MLFMGNLYPRGTFSTIYTLQKDLRGITMTSDTNYPELVHTSQIKGTVLHETSLTSDTAAVQGCTGRPHF